jgi:hypothetical protein
MVFAGGRLEMQRKLIGGQRMVEVGFTHGELVSWLAGFGRLDSMTKKETPS